MLCKKGAYRVSELGKIKRSEREGPPNDKVLKKIGSSDRQGP